MAFRQSGAWSGLVFSAVAGLGFVPVARSTPHWLDPTTAVALYLVALGATFVALLASARSSRVLVVIVVLGAGLPFALFADALATTACAVTAAIAFSRTRLLRTIESTSPWLIELAVSLGALAAAELVVDNSLPDMALSVWAYWLVQCASLWWAGGGDARRPARDPFDVAAERAADLMDKMP